MAGNGEVPDPVERPDRILSPGRDEPVTAVEGEEGTWAVAERTAGGLGPEDGNEPFNAPTLVRRAVPGVHVTGLDPVSEARNLPGVVSPPADPVEVGDVEVTGPESREVAHRLGGAREAPVERTI